MECFTETATKLCWVFKITRRLPIN